MHKRCGRCRLLRTARAVVLEAVLGDWRGEGPLVAQEVYDRLGFHLFAALVEHQDLLEGTRDLAPAEQHALWQVYLRRVLGWLRFHGVTWSAERGAWTAPRRRLPPALEWARIRHSEALAYLAERD